MLKEFQEAFSKYISSSKSDVLLDFIKGDRECAKRRTSVYRRNIYNSLIRVLGLNFKVTRRILGETVWRQVASTYISLQPPDQGHLLTYGKSFPDFIHTKNVGGITYLYDLARFEWFRTEAYFAADSDPINSRAFGNVPVSEIINYCLRVNPSARLMETNFSVFKLWEAHNENTGKIECWVEERPQAILIYRKNLEVKAASVSLGEYQFLRGLYSGYTIERSLNMAVKIEPNIDITGTIYTNIMRHIFVDYFLSSAHQDET